MKADLSNLAYTASATSAVALVCFAAMLRDGEGVRVVHERRVLQVKCVASEVCCKSEVCCMRGMCCKSEVCRKSDANTG